MDLGGCALSFVSWPLASMKCGTWLLRPGVSAENSLPVGFVDELGRIGPALADRPDQAAVRSSSFLDLRKRKLHVWERFLGSDRYVPGL